MVAELKGADRPDLLVTNPHRSLVIQVKGSQIVASASYKTLGMTLRFPRFIKLRLDRAGDSSMTEKELRRLKEITAGTLAKSGLVEGGEEKQPKRQVNRAKGKMAMVRLIYTLRGYSVNNTFVCCRLLKGPLLHLNQNLRIVTISPQPF